MPFPSPLARRLSAILSSPRWVTSMNAPEDDADAVDALNEETEREMELSAVEGRGEKPFAEPYDPYFGRSLSESFPWSWAGAR